MYDKVTKFHKNGEIITTFRDLDENFARGMIFASMLYEKSCFYTIDNSPKKIDYNYILKNWTYHGDKVTYLQIYNDNITGPGYFIWVKIDKKMVACVHFDNVSFLSGFISYFEGIDLDFRDYIIGKPFDQKEQFGIEGYDLIDIKDSIYDMDLTIDENFYNPKIVPIDLYDQELDIYYKLVQDSYLEAGTKQRGLKFFEKIALEDNYDKFVSYATTHGYGQVAMAYCCKYVGLECHIFVEKLDYQDESGNYRTYMTMLAMEYGAIIHEIKKYPRTTIRDLKIAAQKFKEENNRTLFVHMGLDDDQYIQELAEAIKKSTSGISKPKRIWLAAGSGVILRALNMVFPDSIFMIVQVGKNIYQDILDSVKNKIVFRSDVPFKKDTDVIPPYDALLNYDAKIWKYFKIYGKDGDLIWNVK